MVFAARQLQEKCQETQIDAYSNFVDLTKVFDTVNCEGLWKIMQKFSYLKRSTQMVGRLHDGMVARVTDDGAVPKAFELNNGVKQDCVLAPTLFTLMRMHFQSRVSTTTVHELLFADKYVLNITSEGDMQGNIDLFAFVCDNFGLVINTEETEVMNQPPPYAAYFALQINVDGDQLQVVGNCTYLDSIPSRITKIDDEVARRISKASQAFDYQGLSLNTILMMYNDVIMPAFMYEADTWTLSPTDTDVEMARPDPGHRCDGADGNPQNLGHGETAAIALGRPPRVDDERLLKRLYGDVATGPRRQGGQVPRYKDTLKTSLNRLQTNPIKWEDLARDRLTRRRTMKRDATIYEANCITAAKGGGETRKSRLRQPRNAIAQPPPTCQRC
nr:unnamed protein product [Spirometra erinaceieuropaei]